MAFNTFASATSSIPLANLDANFTAIGTSAAASTLYPTATTSITYGSSATNHIFNTTGNVGVGTSSPIYPLDVAGTCRVGRLATQGSTSRIDIDSSGTGGVGGWDLLSIASTNSVETSIGAFGSGLYGYVGTYSNHPLILRTVDAERVRITTTGNVGIGTTAPTYALQISTDSAAKPSTNTWTIASDERIKNVTGEYTKGLDAVCALRPVTYEYNGKAGFAVDGKENISIIAQEAVQHFPECVGTFNSKLNETDETETELYNWNGHALTFALVNAVKELKAELDAVKAELAELK